MTLTELNDLVTRWNEQCLISGKDPGLQEIDVITHYKKRYIEPTPGTITKRVLSGIKPDPMRPFGFITEDLYQGLDYE